MIRRRVTIVFILALFFAVSVFSQDKQPDDKDKKLREEILAVYKSKGEQALRDFVKKQKDKISNKFIVDFAEAGKMGNKEEWLKACKITAEERKDRKTMADVYLSTGKYFRSISDNKKADNYLEKALPIYLKLNDPVGQGNVYLEKGLIYLRIGENSKAFEMYDKALFFFKKAGNTVGQAYVYKSKGDMYLRIGENSKALEMYDRALPFFKKAIKPIGQGSVYLRKGYIYFYTGDNSRAIEMYDKALPFYEKAGSLIGKGNVYKAKGEIYFYNGDNSKSLDMLDKALPFYEKVGEPLGQGNIYHFKGNIYARIRENSKALEMYDKALPFFKKAGDPLGQGNVYISTGEIYLRIGKNLKALEMYDKALPFFEKVEEPLGQGNVYHNKGNIYFSIGENSRALEMYDKALSFFEKAGEPLGQGGVYLRKGNIYFSIGENSRALEMYDKALPFFKKAGEPYGEGIVYHNKGNIYFSIGENSKALVMYDKTLPFYEKVGDPIAQGQLHSNRADIYLKIGDYSRALDLYDKALDFFSKYGDIDSESISLHGKAKVLAKLGKKEKALDLFEKGIANLEKIRTQTAFSEMKRAFMEKVHKQYEEAVLFMLENRFYGKGFKYAESMRARVFMDRIAEGLVRLDKGLATDMKEKRNKLVAKLSLITKEMHRTAGKKDEKKLRELKEQYQKVGNELEELLIKIRLDNPLYALVRYPQPVSVRDMQKELLKKGELLLRYFIAAHKLYVFAISKEKFKVVPINVNEKEMNETIKYFLNALNEHNFSHIKRYGNKLYEKLFKPMEPALQGNRDIIIVPDGQLAKIPFESLVINNKRPNQPTFLLEKYHIKYIQSASLLSVLRRYYRRDSETRSFVGFGDSVYDYESFKQGKPEQGTFTRSQEKDDEIRNIHRSRYGRAGGILDRLQASGEEVKAIARLFEKKSQKCMVHLRAQANEKNAKAADMKNFDYIHFACHGLLNDDFQSLVLSQLPPDKSKEDGYFTLNEIMNCDYNAKLVVLSACQTGSGKMERAEGVTGLTRAVMYAGTPAVIASLWKVDDKATKELMVRFYENLLEKNLDKTEALRQAKLELMKISKYSSPLFWSSFVMYGE